MMLTDLAQAARKSGLPVVEVDGWRARGHGQLVGVRTIVPHHTATPSTAKGDYPSLRVVRDGRTGLKGPLANLGLGRDGTVYVIAAGVAWHAGEVRAPDYGNVYSIGIEAEHPGVGAWTARQYNAYVRLCVALCEHYHLPASRVLGHKEVCAPVGRKSDPNFDMKKFRHDVVAGGRTKRDADTQAAIDHAKAAKKGAGPVKKRRLKEALAILRKIGAKK